MSDPIKFTRVDGGEGVLFCCGKCGHFCGHDADYARYHCGGKPCSRCGKPSDKHRVMCEKCIAAEREAKRQSVRDKAEVVSALDYDGPVYWEENEQFFDGIDEAFEALWDAYDALWEVDNAGHMWREAQTLYTCNVFHLVLDAEQIINEALECQSHHEDTYETVPYKGLKRLYDFIDHWNAEYGRVVATWEPNYKNRIEIPSDWWNKQNAEHISIMEETS